MKFLTCLSVSLLLASSPVKAAEWWHIGKPETKGPWLADLESLTAVGQGKAVWVLSFASAYADKVQQSKVRYSVNCEQNTIKTLTEVEYGKGGTVLRSFTPTYPTDEAIVPESMGEAVANFVCLDPRLYESKGISGPVDSPEARFLPRAPQPAKRLNRKRK